jgi:hypothetical protein
MADDVVTDISSFRVTPDNETVVQNLGLLGELAGTWEGEGFNLIARPDFKDKTNLFLQLNLTREHFKVDPIGSPIPNRGFGQKDIALYGLTYLQKITDLPSGGALHIEPGIWIKQPETTYPPETAAAGQQLIARMGTIPHGNSLLAQGTAASFKGDPTLTLPTAQYNGSQFPSFNSTPFAIPPAPASPTLNAAGSSEALSVPTPPGPPGFTQYDLSIPASPTNTRTNPVPPGITQDIVNDPILLLQAVINKQKADGHSFSGAVLNISTQAKITFFKNKNSTKPTDPTVTVNVANGAGGIENILFLEGGNPVGGLGANADTALVYATFWIEKVTHPTRPPFMQLQYAQMVILDFEIFAALPKNVNFGWPHISVATLKKSFS